MHAEPHGTTQKNMEWEYYTKDHKYMVILPTYVALTLHWKIEGNNIHSMMSSYFTPNIHFMRAEILNIMLYTV